MTFDSVADSGERRSFDTGSVRDVRTGKGRYDLIPPLAMARIARHFENGAVKYGDKNWELGQPLSSYLDSGLRHTYNLLDLKVDEDHAAAGIWNLIAFLCTADWIIDGRLPRALDDIGYCDALVEARESDDLDDESRYAADWEPIGGPPVEADMAVVTEGPVRTGPRTTVLSDAGVPGDDEPQINADLRLVDPSQGWVPIGFVAGTDRVVEARPVQASLDRDQHPENAWPHQPPGSGPEGESFEGPY